MKRALIIGLEVLAAIAISAMFWFAASADAGVSPGTYSVNVSRLTQDVYKDHRSGAIILTRYCYEYAHHEDATLIVRDYTGWTVGKIVFHGFSDTVCDVASVE